MSDTPIKTQADLSLLFRSGLFKGLDEATGIRMMAQLDPVAKSVGKKSIFVHQGDRIGSIALLKSGSLMGEKYHFDGTSHILKVYIPGDILCLEAAVSRFATSPVTLIALEPCSLLLIPFERITDKALFPAQVRETMMFNLMSLLADDNIRLLYKIDVLSRRGLRERILTHLSIIQEKRNTNPFRIGMNQEQLAQYLCVDRSALSYELNQLRREGILTYRRDSYTFLKPFKDPSPSRRR